jgi:hypothetical protein
MVSRKEEGNRTLRPGRNFGLPMLSERYMWQPRETPLDEGDDRFLPRIVPENKHGEQAHMVP